MKKIITALSLLAMSAGAIADDAALKNKLEKLGVKDIEFNPLRLKDYAL